MSLKSLLAEGLLRPHRTSKREVDDLFRLVDRDLADAAVTKISADRRSSLNKIKAEGGRYEQG